MIVSWWIFIHIIRQRNKNLMKFECTRMQTTWLYIFCITKTIRHLCRFVNIWINSQILLLFTDSIDFSHHSIIEPKIIHSRQKRAVENTLEKVSGKFPILYTFTRRGRAKKIILNIFTHAISVRDDPRIFFLSILISCGQWTFFLIKDTYLKSYLLLRVEHKFSESQWLMGGN